MKIAIVGLGAAGLYAAKLLKEKGVEIQLFESKARIGGRIHTKSDFRAGFFEIGGEWIDADHDRFLNLIDDLGIELRLEDNIDYLLKWNGQQCLQSQLWPEASKDFDRFIEKAKELANRLQDPPWLNHCFVSLDKRTLKDLIEETCQSVVGNWWTTAYFRSDEGEELQRVSLLGWLCNYRNYLTREGKNSQSCYRVPIGMSAVFEQLQNGLDLAPYLGWKLEAICQTSNDLTLKFNENQVHCDKVLLAIPARCVEKIQFDPYLPQSQTKAIKACKYGRVIKVVLRFQEPWWNDVPGQGFIVSSGPIQQVWNCPWSSQPKLCAYICGDDSVRISKLQEGEFCLNPQAAELLLNDLAEVSPQAKQSFIDGAVYDWSQDPYAGGGFCYFGQGYVLNHLEHLAKPHGRVFFAGEHTSHWTGFIEGALESAERAVEEMLNA